jgi:hypothetical protein
MSCRRILVLAAEFLTWPRARPWSYTACWATVQALRAQGNDCLILPVFPELSLTARESWISRAREILKDQRFDQIWIWLVHSRLDDAFLSEISSVAPVRAGIAMESLRYTEEDLKVFPFLRTRHSYVVNQFKHLTHVLLYDEADVEEVNAAANGPEAMWWPAAVPRQFVTRQIQAAEKPVGAFYGTLYGERSTWLQKALEEQLVMQPQSPEDNSPRPHKFEYLNSKVGEMLANTQPDLNQLLTFHVESLEKLRREMFDGWLESLKGWRMVLNLPSLVKAYPGRIVESMAAGVPVVSWRVPSRPRNLRLFKPGAEILLYENQTEMLEHLRLLKADADLARQIAANALEKVLRYHTSEGRVGQAMEFIEEQKLADFGENG